MGEGGGRRYRPRTTVPRIMVFVLGVAILSSCAGNDETPTTADEPGPTSSTTRAVTGREYTEGDCVTWDQDATSTDQPPTRVVPCDQEHLIEIAGHMEAPAGLSSDYPSDAVWNELRDTECRRIVERHMRGPLDPKGRYQAGWLRPLPAAWANGERTAWCGIIAIPIDVAVSRDIPAELRPFTGRARIEDQQQLYDAGTCLTQTPDGGIAAVVACTEPHSLEIPGAIQLDQTAARPVTDEAWQTVAIPPCRRLAAAYLNRPLSRDVLVGFFRISQASWDAGARKVECTLVRADNALMTASLRA